MFKNTYFALLLLPLTLAACNNAAPTKKDVTDLYNQNVTFPEGRKVQLTDLRCTQHENAKYICFIGYNFISKDGKPVPGSTQMRENAELFRLNNKWVGRGL